MHELAKRYMKVVRMLMIEFEKAQQLALRDVYCTSDEADPDEEINFEH